MAFANVEASCGPPAVDGTIEVPTQMAAAKSSMHTLLKREHVGERVLGDLILAQAVVVG